MRDRLAVVVLIAVALGLRLYGINWGLPDALHGYSFHPDEFLTIGAAGAIIGGFLPRFYNYPSLYLYASALLIALALLICPAPTQAAPYLIARLLTALMGTAAVAATFWAGIVLFGSGIGFLAGVVLCIAPAHVQHSHFATVDVPSTLFVAACIGFAGRVLKGGGWRDYVLAGMMAGLAAGTKYNAGLVLLSVVAAHLLRSKSGSERAPGKLVLLGTGCALVAFIVSTPGVILEWGNFLHGFAYEMGHAAQGHGLVFAGTGNGFVYTFATSLWWGLGPALAVLFAAAVVYGLWRRDPRALMILAFVIPYYVLMSLSQVRFVRYTLPMFPAAALLIAWLLIDVWDRARERQQWNLERVCAAVLGLAVVSTLVYTLALDRLFTQPPPQTRAARWMLSRVPKGSSVGFLDVPWFYHPPLSPELGTAHVLNQPGRPAMMAGLSRIVAQTPYSLFLFGQNAPGFTRVEPRRRPEWVIAADYDTLDALRIRGDSRLSPDQRRDRDRLLAAMAILKRDYTEVSRFDNRLWPSLFDGGTEYLPHDMRYPSPTIAIYRLRR